MSNYEDTYHGRWLETHDNGAELNFAEVNGYPVITTGGIPVLARDSWVDSVGKDSKLKNGNPRFINAPDGLYCLTPDEARELGLKKIGPYANSSVTREISEEELEEIKKEPFFNKDLNE